MEDCSAQRHRTLYLATLLRVTKTDEDAFLEIHVVLSLATGILQYGQITTSDAKSSKVPSCSQL